METSEYKLKSAQKSMPALRGLELDIANLGAVENQNVRKVALRARNVRERMDIDPSYEIQGTYSEAYSGEQA